MSIDPSVCLSVHLPVTRRYSVETAKHIIKLFLPLASHTIVVFFIPERYETNFNGSSLSVTFSALMLIGREATNKSNQL